MQRKRRWLLAAICAVISVIGAAPEAAVPELSGQSRPAQALLWVGLLLSDGILVPFAAYKSGRWSDPWPKPDEAIEAEVHQLNDIPASWLGGAPLPSMWFLQWTDGRAATLRAREPISYGAHCQSAWGLQTDQSPTAPEESHTMPVGVALSAEKTLEPMKHLAEDSPERERVASALRPVFQELEEEEIGAAVRSGAPVEGGKLKYTGHPIGAAERESIPLDAGDLYRSASIPYGYRLYYVEAAKKYPNPLSVPDGQCWGLSFFQGWLVEDGDGNLSWLKKNLALSDCDGVELSTSIPLGMLTLDGRIYLVVYSHYYESESYSILEFDGGELREVIETHGGGC